MSFAPTQVTFTEALETTVLRCDILIEFSLQNEFVLS